MTPCEQELTCQLEQCQQALAESRRENALLRQKVDLLVKRVFGSSSERLDPAQLELLMQLPPSATVTVAVVTPEKTRVQGSRQERVARLPENLPVVEEVIEPEPVKAQPEQWRCIGQEVSEQLDYEPGRFLRRRVVRKKYVHRTEREGAPLIAALPERLLDRGLLIYTAAYLDKGSWDVDGAPWTVHDSWGGGWDLTGGEWALNTTSDNGSGWLHDFYDPSKPWTAKPDYGAEYVSTDPTDPETPALRDWQNEYCELGDHSPLADEFYPPLPHSVMYARHTRTKQMLHIGGKPGSKEMNLYEIHAYITSMPDLHFWEPGTYPAGLSTEVDWSKVTIAGHKVGSDGVAWVALPDNSPDLSLTPTYTGPGSQFYGFDAVAIKHHLYITANGINLETNTPTFCVGQDVRLQVSATPGLPLGTTTKQEWDLSGYWANYILQVLPNSSPLYVINYNLKTNNVMDPVWWYGAGNAHVWCDLTNIFPNGQTVEIKLSGLVSIYRPSISLFLLTGAGYLTNHDGNLELGDGDGHGDLMYEVDVSSAYAGRTDIRQVVNRYAFNGLNPPTTTSGAYYLDNYLFYSGHRDDPNGAWVVTANSFRPLFFSDSPTYPLAKGVRGFTTTISDHFIDYVMFRPDAGDPNSNIYVSLGQASWNWYGTSTWTLFGGWSAPAGVVVPPTHFDNSDAFPIWSSVYK